MPGAVLEATLITHFGKINLSMSFFFRTLPLHFILFLLWEFDVFNYSTAENMTGHHIRFLCLKFHRHMVSKVINL